MTFSIAQIRRIFRKWAEREEAKMLEGREADAGFDGGEWSGPAHERAWQAREELVAELLTSQLYVPTALERLTANEDMHAYLMIWFSKTGYPQYNVHAA